MKNAKTKSILVILGTLLIGMLLGGLITGHLIHGRVRDFMNMRGGKGFQEGVIQAANPTPAQAASINPILETFAQRMDSMHSQHMADFETTTAVLDSALAKYLDAQQMENVRQKLRRMSGHGRGGDHDRGPGGHHPRNFHHGRGQGE